VDSSSPEDEVGAYDEARGPDKTDGAAAGARPTSKIFEIAEMTLLRSREKIRD
jgi:hypothetical protein